jgi:adenylosuccinate synthase
MIVHSIGYRCYGLYNFTEVIMNIAILGAAFGDEGKGHVAHHLSRNYNWVVRFNGGANAGHTIYRDGVKYVHNLMPSFDWRSPFPKAFLSSGMVIDLTQLHLEVSKLYEIDKNLPKRVYVDPDAFLVLESHKEQDKNENSHIGSTNRGIGPAYRSKIERHGLKVRDALNGNISDNWVKLAIPKLIDMGVQFKTILELRSQMESQNILFEGAQGVMLDINHGTYPYVSCSESTVAGVYSCGFHWAPPKIVYGVAKVYTTKVGEGPFPTELQGKEAESLRERGKEYGATTGRPRKIGWLDLPALKYACDKGGINSLIITKFDILDGMKEIPVCSKYETAPISGQDFFTAKPEYINVSGWDDSKQSEQLRPFIETIEKTTGRDIGYISCGTSDSDIKVWSKNDVVE